MEFIDPFASPIFLKWLFGQSVAFVTLAFCLIAWNRSLTKQLNYERRRNTELSNSLIQNIESGLRQRAKDIDDFALRSDSSTRNLLDFFKGLSSKPSTTEHSSARKAPMPHPFRLPLHQPTSKRLPPSDEEPTPTG